MVSLFIALAFYFVYFAADICRNNYYGYYKIDKQWIASVDEKTNIIYCDECLWIRFYEGCDRYFIYYFEEEHETNSIFEDGDPINIKFIREDGQYLIKGIKRAVKYANKC